MDGDEPLVELEGQQLAIYRAIAEQDETLASWYYGARVALATRGNPEDLVHAAHSISELMNNLHTVAEVPAKREEGRLGDKFDAMAGKWEKGKQTPSASATGDGRGRLTMQLGVLSQPSTMQLNGSGRTGRAGRKRIGRRFAASTCHNVRFRHGLRRSSLSFGTNCGPISLMFATIVSLPTLTSSPARSTRSSVSCSTVSSQGRSLNSKRSMT
jgi:hypothetical protein